MATVTICNKGTYIPADESVWNEIETYIKSFPATPKMGMMNPDWKKSVWLWMLDYAMNPTAAGLRHQEFYDEYKQEGYKFLARDTRHTIRAFEYLLKNYDLIARG